MNVKMLIFLLFKIKYKNEQLLIRFSIVKNIEFFLYVDVWVRVQV